MKKNSSIPQFADGHKKCREMCLLGNKIRDAFNEIHAEDELKEKTMKFILAEIGERKCAKQAGLLK